jgi:hypothetical protein
MAATRHGLLACVAMTCAVLHIGANAAEVPTFALEIRDHLFYPSELVIPADTKIKLIVTNTDPTPEEFESYELNREKVIMGGARAIIFLGPLPPGTYPFFGEFNPKTAQGVVRVDP